MRTEVSKETFLFVNDLEAAEAFYTTVLGLTVAQRVEREYSLLNYDEGTLTLFRKPASPIAYAVTASGSPQAGQVSFNIRVSDILSWRKHLKKHAVFIDEEINWPNGAQSLCFHDPTGNRIRLTTQIEDVHNTAADKQLQKVGAAGFNARWKLYHAANLGVKRGLTKNE